MTTGEGLVCVASKGLAGGVFGSVAMIGVTGRFFRSVAKTRLRGGVETFSGLAAANHARYYYSFTDLARPLQVAWFLWDSRTGLE